MTLEPLGYLNATIDIRYFENVTYNQIWDYWEGRGEVKLTSLAIRLEYQVLNEAAGRREPGGTTSEGGGGRVGDDGAGVSPEEEESASGGRRRRRLSRRSDYDSDEGGPPPPPPPAPSQEEEEAFEAEHAAFAKLASATYGQTPRNEDYDSDEGGPPPPARNPDAISLASATTAATSTSTSTSSNTIVHTQVFRYELSDPSIASSFDPDAIATAPFDTAELRSAYVDRLKVDDVTGSFRAVRTSSSVETFDGPPLTPPPTPAPKPPPVTKPPDADDDGGNTGMIAGIVIGSVGGLILFFALVWYGKRKRGGRSSHAALVAAGGGVGADGRADPSPHNSTTAADASRERALDAAGGSRDGSNPSASRYGSSYLTDDGGGGNNAGGIPGVPSSMMSYDDSTIAPYSIAAASSLELDGIGGGGGAPTFDDPSWVTMSVDEGDAQHEQDISLLDDAPPMRVANINDMEPH